MKVIEHLTKAKEPLITFEIIPPKRGGDIHGILSVLDDIMKYKPKFIDITSHSPEAVYEKPIPEGRSANKTTADLVRQIADMNKGKYLEDSLLDAKPSNYCVGVGGYPEKHFEAPNLKSDIKFCKEKLDAGADYVVTQMFFDNKVYFKYVELCKKEGIAAPIIPGLKIISSKSHLLNIPKNFYVSLPDH